MITFRHLRYFEALARHRHFSRAADECLVTQPALSMRVQELETTLGTTLVERRRGAIALTPIGEEVARRAVNILLSVQDLRDYAIAASGTLAGPLALGIIPTVAPYILAPMLKSLRVAFPKLQLTIFEAQTEKLLEEIAAGRLDGALLSVPAGQVGLSEIGLFEDGFVVAASAESPLARIETTTLEDLSEAHLLLLDEGHCLREQVLSFCRIGPKRPQEQYGAASLGTIMQLVADGQGATLLPEIAIPVEMRGDTRITLRRFEGSEPQRTIGLTWRETSPRADELHLMGSEIAKVGQALITESRKVMAEMKRDV